MKKLIIALIMATLVFLAFACARVGDVEPDTSPKAKIIGKWSFDDPNDWLYEFGYDFYKINEPGEDFQGELTINDSIFWLDNGVIRVEYRYIVSDDSLTFIRQMDNNTTRLYRFNGH